MPAQTLAPIKTRRLRLVGRALCLAKLDAGPKAIQVQFIENPPLDPAKIIKLLQSDRTVKLAGQDKLTWAKQTATLNERTTAARELLKRLAP